MVNTVSDRHVIDYHLRLIMMMNQEISDTNKFNYGNYL